MAKFRICIPQADVYGFPVINSCALGALQDALNGDLETEKPEAAAEIRKLTEKFSVLVYNDTPPLRPRVFCVKQVTTFDIVEAEGY